MRWKGQMVSENICIVSKLYSYILGGVEFRVEINIIYESEIIAHR